MSYRRKFLYGLILLTPIVLYLFTNVLNLWSVKNLTVKELTTAESRSSVFNKRIKLTGQVDGKSIKFNKTTSEMRFNLVSNDGKNIIHVLFISKEMLSLKDKIIISVEGKYTVEKLFIAEKIVN